MSLVLLSLGSNLGDRAANLETAVRALSPWVQVTVRSSVYETSPWGYTEQPPFLNMALGGLTHLPPRRLLYRLKGIESRLGRKATFRYGPRVIDLDILAYDDLVLETPALTIPHPRLQERAFVLVPLCEIAPAWVHPVLGKTACALRQAVDVQEVYPLR
ncbi:MAG TPA: 2-amino-4-hydroxy-6-hydroxymethyldihydropteridine diphosphokinase [Chloroflexi bacterium]|nr:2-amino-4-hydroxy-6-hydroxymethyldihydropteridine diphosphokinase [Chloroflexota bacterium]